MNLNEQLHRMVEMIEKLDNSYDAEKALYKIIKKKRVDDMTPEEKIIFDKFRKQYYEINQWALDQISDWVKSNGAKMDVFMAGQQIRVYKFYHAGYWPNGKNKWDRKMVDIYPAREEYHIKELGDPRPIPAADYLGILNDYFN